MSENFTIIAQVEKYLQPDKVHHPHLSSSFFYDDVANMWRHQRHGEVTCLPYFAL